MFFEVRRSRVLFSKPVLLLSDMHTRHSDGRQRKRQTLTNCREVDDASGWFLYIFSFQKHRYARIK